MFDYNFFEEIKLLKKRTEKIYIYGAGFRGRDLYKILLKNDINVDGFVVSKKNELEEIDGVKIYEANCLLSDDKNGFILGLSDINTAEVVAYLKKIDADFTRIVDGGKYLSEYRGTMELRNENFLEITTVMGCKVNCRFCPQNLLVTSYFKDNKKRKRELTVEDFKIILDKLPQNCVVMFAGMAEPFLNHECTELLRCACNSGRKVRLYTTLVGATRKDIEEIINLPLDFVGLHIADENGYAKINRNEEYYSMVKLLIDSKKKDGSSFLDDITSQGIPDKTIEEMLNGKFEIITAVQDRAGNLEDLDATKREGKLKAGKFICTYCGEKVNNQVLLPDGTILLCQMDYGMKHVLGNLLSEDYEKIRKSKMMIKVLDNMAGKTKDELLCDTCLYAKEI